MKKGFFLFLITLVCIGNSYANIHRVCSTCPTTTITEAIEIAQAHDTILIGEGVYSEGLLTIKKPLTLLGQDFPVLDGKLENGLLHLISDSVHIEGLVIKNVSTSYIEDHAGLKVSNSKHFSIKNNKLYNTFFGIFIAASSYGLIENNVIIGEAVDQINSGNGIHLWQCNNISIIDNHVKKHRDGIYFE